VLHLDVSSDPAGATAAWIAARLRDAAQRRGGATLALSGGSTAPPMIAAIVACELPWHLVTVWQVDERIAPDGHDARNANQLVDLPCRVRPMPVTAADLAAAARRYDAGLPDRFDVVHLGIGDDGHTASWPPGDPSPITSPRGVELVPEFHGWRRMTLTRRAVNGARRRAVLAVGSAKRPVVERWCSGDRSLPIGAVRRSGTTVFLDGAAAPVAGPADRRDDDRAGGH
jgi:6-phosphogluconolactonase/glucosamine-6-phosphate isomerase/deaminase